MKFRALATQFEAIQTITKSLQATCKLATNGVFCLSPTGITVIADPTYKSGFFLSRCELRKENLFSQYSFNGISSDHNLIYFDVKSEALSQILRALHGNIKSLKLQLTNSEQRRFALKMTVEYPSDEGSRFVEYKLFISIMNRKYWSAFDEQQLEPINVSVNFTDTKQIASTVEKLATISQYATITGKHQPNNQAYLTIGHANAHIAIKSKFSKLNLSRNFDQNLINYDEIYKIEVDVRRLNQAFSAIYSLIKPTSTKCNILHRKAVYFVFSKDLVNFKIILPNNNHNQDE